MRPLSLTSRMVGLVTVTGVLVAASCKQQHPEKETVKFDTEYQAVLLTNGQVFFGKLEGLGTPYPVLKEVYYVQTVQDPQTKQPTNILVKRGKEWHAPDRMILNASHILLVEPVTKDSKVAQLIAEEKNKK